MPPSREQLTFFFTSQTTNAGHRLDPTSMLDPSAASAPHPVTRPYSPLLASKSATNLSLRTTTTSPAFRRTTSSPHPPDAPPPPPLRVRCHAPTSGRVGRPRHSFVFGSLRSHKRTTLLPTYCPPGMPSAPSRSPHIYLVHHPSARPY
ncbi:hypothetical protein C8F04DRAFT_1257169 [Mycena alexandri]|uniref:Uncharacterized protein n=1 Tax=Mycena alexandri TaxID=1745969 RepID=A0AAD6X6G7_9AGAR|nr:hypothetical protein C8F04DRAFT_1257169 [Mycena alexandri]